MRTISGVAAVLLFAGQPFMGSAQAASLTLVNDGQPAATIVLGQPATKAAQLAAYELQWHILQSTGARLPIATAGQRSAGTRILVGASAATEALGVKAADLKSQEYIVSCRPGVLLLLGCDKPDTTEVSYDFSQPNISESWPGPYDEQGTLYATYDFLERCAGVRWFNSTEFGAVIPKTATLLAKGQESRRTPAFRTRNACVGGQTQEYDAVNCMWTGEKYKEYEAAAFPELHKRFTNTHQYMLAKRTANSLFHLRMRAGGERCFCNHSMYSYYQRYWEKSNDPNAAKLFRERKPEIFAQGYPAGTVPPQMCYTSRELIRLVARQAADYFKNGGHTEYAAMEAPGPGWGENFFACEPMDNNSFCRCPECRKWYEPNEKDDSPFAEYGRHSEYFFQFVNEVAKETAKTNPDKFINTLAYGSHLRMPQKLRLEPNVAVHFCFDTNRLPYDRPAYAEEVRLLREWAAKDQGRALYLWLYYTFPNEVANNGQWFAFPGFFAHVIGKQFKLFQETGIRGMFHCGYGQEVEAYVTYKLMENADLDVDSLLDDYFARYYGPAGKPLKKFYALVEQAYCDPDNYPIVGGKRYAGHQSKIVAWDYLGNEERMARLEKLMGEARAAAARGSDAERKRIALFERSIWSYMVAGRAQHLQHSNAPIPRMKAPRVPEAGGDVSKVAWAAAAPLGGTWYERGADKPSTRRFEGRICHDGANLYLELTDHCATAKLQTSSGVFCYDDWEVFFARQRALPYRQYAVGPTGLTVALSHGEVNWRMNVPVTDRDVIKAVADTQAPDAWITRLVFPMQKVVAGGVAAGQIIYMNVTRVAGPEIAGQGPYGIDTWVSFCSVHDVDRLAEITLEP